jgi:hypothetical protein
MLNTDRFGNTIWPEDEVMDQKTAARYIRERVACAIGKARDTAVMAMKNGWDTGRLTFGENGGEIDRIMDRDTESVLHKADAFGLTDADWQSVGSDDPEFVHKGLHKMSPRLSADRLAALGQLERRWKAREGQGPTQEEIQEHILLKYGTAEELRANPKYAFLAPVS